MKKTIEESIKHTPEFDNYFYTVPDCEGFIKDNFEPNVLNAYKCLKPAAYKSDLWRYCILYKKGGVYIDIKFDIKLPLINIIEKYPKIYLSKVPPEAPTNQIYNAFLASPPNNPLFKDCIDEIVVNWKNKNYRETPLDITGPHLLYRIIFNHESKEFIDSLPFSYRLPRSMYYNNDELASEYSEYRTNVKKESKYYAHMWDDKEVFDNSIVFV